MAGVMLTYSWLKSIDMILFTVCLVTCIQASNIEVSIRKNKKALCRILICPVWEDAVYYLNSVVERLPKKTLQKKLSGFQEGFCSTVLVNL